MDALASFYSVRLQLGAAARFDPATLTIVGTLHATNENIVALKELEENGYLRDAKIANVSRNLALLNIPKGVVVEISLVLCPISLSYFEGIDDLLKRSENERARYFVFPIGEVSSDQPSTPAIQHYRVMLRAKALLRSVADLESNEKVILLTPQPLVLPFCCDEASLRDLPELASLEKELQKDAVERDQRTALFKRSLREYLYSELEDERFPMFLAKFGLIYDGYRRDFLLWIGQAFGELEKAFEEKRLKFIADLNGILASVQTSILAVPLAVLLVSDKYDVSNPPKNFLLAVTVFIVAVVAHKLLANQSHTLVAIDEAISAVEKDFENKQSQRKHEFKSRLEALRQQQARVSGLLVFLRSSIWVIVAIVFVGWAFSFLRTFPPSLLFSKIPVGAHVRVASPSPQTSP